MTLATYLIRRPRLLACVLVPVLAWLHPEPARADSCAAQQTMAVSSQATEVVGSQDRGFLWRVSKGGTTSYLYGTIHIGKPEWAAPGPQTMAALKASHILALEMDPMVPATLEAMRSGFARQPDQVLAPALETRLREALAADCLPAHVADSFAPEMLISLLTLGRIRADGYGPEWGVDSTLAAHAHARHMPVEALETPQDQIKLVLARNTPERIQQVSETLDDIDSGKSRRVVLQIARMWGNAEYSTLHAYTDWCECSATDKDRQALKALLDDRNLKMAENIDRLHSQGTAVFAAVGSLHMVGTQGIPSWMARNGYTVEQIKFR